MSYIGTNKIKKLYLGTTAIKKAYLGTSLVYQSAVPVFYDRLVFDGTAYIDTDILPSNGDSFNVILGNETQKVAQRVFMAGCTNNTNLGVIYTSSTTTTNRRVGFYYAVSSGAPSRNYAFSNTEYNLLFTPQRYGWNSNSYTYTKGSYAVNSALVIGANVSHSGQAFTGRMGTFYIYGSDAEGVTTASGFSSYTPKYTLRPCTYNGEAGLWCVENGKFYGNTNSSGSLSVTNI